MVVTQFLQLIQHRHRVNGLGEVEHGIDGLINLPVLLVAEILRAQQTHHLIDTLAVDQNGTQHRLFRFQRLGRLTGKQFLVHVFSLLSEILAGIREVLMLPRSSRSEGR